MGALGWVLLSISVAWGLLYFRTSLILWAVLIAVILTLWIAFDDTSRLAQLSLAAIAVALLVPLNVYPIRRWLVSNRVFDVFRHLMPRMSRTEREALEAGSIWWDGELFSGAPRWTRLLRTPAPRLLAREQAFLDGPAEELCQMLDDWEITHERYDLPPQVWRYMKEEGFFGMIIPKRYGGLEFSAQAHSAVVMKVASRSITAAVTVMVPNSLGPAELLLRYGTEEQKNHYLPRLAHGQDIPCFALTGPEAGSDASSMPDTGIVCRAEFRGQSDVIGVRLNWEKRYITLGPVATLLGLAFKLHDPDHLLGEETERGITLALIPTDTVGVEIGRRHFPLNTPFQNGPNRGRNVFIPMDWIIGGCDGVGHGWRMLMETLAAGRSISLPALSTGAGKLSSRATGAYARIRTQFKMSIGRFEGVEEVLARIAAYTYQMDAVRLLTAVAVDQGEKPAVISAIAKYHLTERMRRVVNDAMDIYGGAAICMGPHNVLARAYQAVPISITVEGANILTRSLIIFGQGALRCHPYVLKEINAALETDRAKGKKTFDRLLFAHMGLTLSNLARTLFLGLSGARFAMAPVSGAARRYYQHLTHMSAAFALVSDVSMLVLGGSLKRKEKLSGRLADVLSELYIASACLKRFHDQGEPDEDAPLLQWACEDSLYKIQDSMIGLLRNYPIRPIALLLRMIAYPFGQRFRKPSDTVGHRAASILLQPSSARDRLTDGIYAPQDSREPLGRLDDALVKVIAAEPLESALRNAVSGGRLTEGPTLIERAVESGILSESEADMVRAARTARLQVIAVDDFPPDLDSSHRHERGTPGVDPENTLSAVHSSGDLRRGIQNRRLGV
jgi:acyl-CoA dehydrogenase